MRSEKLTVNLSPVELAQIDYLVEKGLYANRSDFIRLASRKQVDEHKGDFEQFLNPVINASPAENDLVRFSGGVGVLHFTKKSFDEYLQFGKKLKIHFVGVAIFSKNITPEQIFQVVDSAKIYGKIVAEPPVKEALKLLAG